MFSLFIVLLYFSSSLARDQTKCLFLNDESCMIRPTVIDLNPIELRYYPIIISLNKCTESFNVLSPKICVPKETKDIHVEAFNMITNKNEAKAMTEHISCDCKYKFNSTIVIKIKNGIIKHINVNVKIVVRAKKPIVGLLVHAFVRILFE